MARFSFLHPDQFSPQPFNLTEIKICNQTYPQPELSDRLYFDKDAFFVNLPQEVGLKLLHFNKFC